LTENLKAEMTYGPRIRRVPGQMRKGNEMWKYGMVSVFDWYCGTISATECIPLTSNIHGVCTGFIWLRVGISRGLLWHCNKHGLKGENWCPSEMLSNSWVLICSMHSAVLTSMLHDFVIFIYRNSLAMLRNEKVKFLVTLRKYWHTYFNL
jgi:hypothetical protein